MPLHVSGTSAYNLKVKLHYTASGIITPIGVMMTLRQITRKLYAKIFYRKSLKVPFPRFKIGCSVGLITRPYIAKRLNKA